MSRHPGLHEGRGRREPHHAHASAQTRPPSSHGTGARPPPAAAQARGPTGRGPDLGPSRCRPRCRPATHSRDSCCCRPAGGVHAMTAVAAAWTVPARCGQRSSTTRLRRPGCGQFLLGAGDVRRPRAPGGHWSGCLAVEAVLSDLQHLPPGAIVRPDGARAPMEWMGRRTGHQRQPSAHLRVAQASMPTTCAGVVWGTVARRWWLGDGGSAMVARRWWLGDGRSAMVARRWQNRRRGRASAGPASAGATPEQLRQGAADQRATGTTQLRTTRVGRCARRWRRACRGRRGPASAAARR
jgi:hypothetical protein